ncbi:hypothetical protein QVD17_30635 [Tagetes erecta]|uniref:SWIM-type domain-containing protein n=1 Tax=Tagetes erecta TaxID=13708 RepID=A0AAD8NME9_TARER|nr:hypothetical protein QVD17_30635 [Tagetes erecta]
MFIVGIEALTFVAVIDIEDFIATIAVGLLKMDLEDDNIVNQITNDPFLYLLCYEKNNEKEDDAISIEDWSATEQDYESKVYEGYDGEDLYPCYDPTMDWKLTKPILGMKFESPGQLKDSLIDYGVSNGYPLVFPINNHNKLDDIEMEGGLGLTLMSDQHKGIIEAVKDVFPHAEHRQCTRHIYANFKKKFRGVQFMNLFWGDANSITKQQFNEKMEELKAINKNAYTHLMERDPVSWSRAFFEVGRACDAFENGMSESFNSRIRVARRKPIITMLEEIRTFVMHRNFLMVKKAESEEHDVCPRIRKKLEDNKKKQRHWKVIPSDNVIFEVKNEKDAYVVNIDEHTCTCCSWQLSGIPCVHTIAALSFLNKEPETYVSSWFKKEMFKEAYKHPIKPLKGSMFWPKTDDIKPLPPKERRMPGRPTVKRKRDPSEKVKKNSKVGFRRKMTCQKCKEVGHNSKSCKNERRDPQPKESRPKGRPKKLIQQGRPKKSIQQGRQKKTND